MWRTSTRAWLARIVMATIAVVGIAGAPAAAAAGEPVSGVSIASSIIAQDIIPAPMAPVMLVVAVDADTSSGLTVRCSRGKPVAVQARGEKTRTAMVSAAGAPVVFTGLTVGKSCTVSIDRTRIRTATPVATPSPGWGLTVSTTGTAGVVAHAWQHQMTRPQGTVTYRVTATPVTPDGRVLTSPETVAATAPGTAWILEGLDRSVRYAFSVAPVNSAASGAATTAVMSRTLGDILGTGKAPATPSPPAAPTPAPVPEPEPVAPSGSGGPAAPSTRTIYVCPAGYADTGNVCTRAIAYTFHSETVTQPYTFHSGVVGSHVFTHPPTHCGYLPNPTSPTGLDIYC